MNTIEKVANRPDLDPEAGPQRRPLHPVLMMLGMLLVAMVLTYIIHSGQFKRHDTFVIPGTYQAVEKVVDPLILFSSSVEISTTKQAYPATLISLLHSIPDGLSKTSSLIFMVMFVGGMFEVFKGTGALDAGLDRLVQLSGGNRYVLVPLLVTVIGLGSTFLGLMTEYIVLLPVLLELGKRLNLSSLFMLAILSFGAKLGYVASVSNPIVLPIAQPIAGVPIFSGVGVRATIFAVAMFIGSGYLMWVLRRIAHPPVSAGKPHAKLSSAQSAVLVVMGMAVTMLVVAAPKYNWRSPELSAFYICMTVVIGLVGRLSPRAIADAFVSGMKNMMLAALLIGFAASIEIILSRSLVLDTVINWLSSLIQGKSAGVVATGIMGIEAFLDLLVPSTSGKAAVSMPILAPIAQISGLGGQSCVLAFLLGNGIMSIINPTSGVTLALLAIAKVGYAQWLRFAVPVVLAMTIFALMVLSTVASTGY